MKTRFLLSSLLALSIMGCSTPMINTSQDFSDLEKEYDSPKGAPVSIDNTYKSFSTKALSDAYVQRMFNNYLTTAPNPTQIIRQLEFARYLKNNSDTNYFDSLRTIITNNNSIYTKITDFSEVSQKMTTESGTFGDFVISLNPNRDLVGYWSFDNGTGVDSSNKANNGTIVGNPEVVSGVRGNALKFDGVDDYVNVPDSSSLRFSQTITVSLWYKTSSFPTDGGEHYIISKMQSGVGGNGFNSAFTDYANNDLLFFRARVVGAAWIGTGLPFSEMSLNQYHHIVFTYDGSIAKTYLDGILKDSYNAPGLYIGNTTDSLKIAFGDWDINSKYFAGIIDEVRVYTRALSAGEALNLYNLSY